MAEFFDPLSFVLGAGTTAAVGGGIYAVRSRRNTTPGDEPDEGKERAFEVFSPQSGSRYAVAMRRFFRYMHLPGEQIALTDVVVEPRFLLGRPPVLAIEEDEEGILQETDIYRVIPLVHQFPSVYASFYMETLGLLDLETGSPHMAILGVPGMGKSTTLALLGLIALGELDPDSLKTEEETQFDYSEEEKDLPEEVRERRRKEREEVQRRAIEQLRIVQKREDEAKAAEARDAAVDFDKLFPIYAHVHHIDLNPDAYGGTIEPAEPLVRALHHYIDKNTAETSPPLIYRMIDAGEALIMIDGFDELTPEESAYYLEWLAALREHHGNNIIIITGPASGYDPLAHLGFAPVFIRPFAERHHEKLLLRWLDKWEKLPAESEVQRLRVDNRNRSILDVTMKIWATLSGDIQETGRRGYYENYVRHQVGEIENATAILQDVAAYWLDTGLAADREMLRRVARHHLGIPEPDAESEPDDKKGKTKKAPAKGAEDKTLDKIGATALIHPLPNGGFGFKHPVLAWYLAGETLKNTNEGRLVEIANKPNWHGALSFATAIIDLEPAVLQRVRNQPDLLLYNLISVADWIPDAPAGLRWVGEILKRLGAVFIQPNQFPAVREHVLAALVTTRDSSGGITYIFRQAVRSGNPVLRRLGSVGLGAVGSAEAVNDLNPMLFDEVIDVQLAAGLALASIGTEESLTPMTEALLEGDRNLRRAVAEAFASIPGEGHAILRDGITHEDLEVRRACAFGLSRIAAIWALVALYRAMLEDAQWAVRQAAENAFTQAREPKSMGPQPYPEPEHYEWLAAWAGQYGEAVPEGLGGRQVLMKALQGAPEPLKVESARALGRLAHTPAVKALYATLSDANAEVRAAAFHALGDMADRIGKPLPGVM